MAQYGYYNLEQIRQDQSYGTQSNPKVWVMEEFKNAEVNHLGIALPKGKLRFYRRDTDGHLEFVGENVIDHTPKDETIRIFTGNSFDIVGERKRTNFTLDSHRNVATESLEIKVRNHKDSPVEERMREPLYRRNQWAIRKSSEKLLRETTNTQHVQETIEKPG